MPRELNKDLFSGSSAGSSAGDKSVWGDETVKRHDVLLREMSLEMARLKRQIKETELKLDATNQRMAEWGRGAKATLERLQGQQTRLEQLVKAALQDLKAKLTGLAGRFNERRSSEVKIQELVDRHNQVLQQFEARMQNMQKLISEQDLKIAGYQASLKDMQRREVTR